MKNLACSLLCAFAVLASPARAAAQNAWVTDWLTEYADPDTRAAVVERLSKIGNLNILLQDLELLLDPWLEAGESPDTQRRVVAAFALEAAYARLGSGVAAVDVAEWGCRQVRRIREPGEFERQWHLAAFALYSGVVDPKAIESHVGHMRLQFRSEPRLTFQRGVAQELRAAPFFENGKASARDVQKRYEEAARHYREAAEQDSVKTDASLRLGHSLLALGQYDEALEALAGVDETDDEFVLFLAHLFRGQALERIDRIDDAIREYGLAVAIRPGAQSVSMAQAALMFRIGQRGISDRVVSAILGRTSQPDDPWWDYWPADFRFAAEWIANMRELLR